jgi:hypothetical protein
MLTPVNRSAAFFGPRFALQRLATPAKIKYTNVHYITGSQK